MRTTKTSLTPAGDTNFKVSGVIRLNINSGGELANVVFGVSPVLATKIIHDTAFIDKSVK